MEKKQNKTKNSPFDAESRILALKVKCNNDFDLNLTSTCTCSTTCYANNQLAVDQVLLVDLVFTTTEELYTVSLFQDVCPARARLSVFVLLPSLESFYFILFYYYLSSCKVYKSRWMYMK